MKGYKTIFFAVLLAAFGAVQVSLPAVQQWITPKTYGWATLVIAVIVAVLRAMTDTALFKRE